MKSAIHLAFTVLLLLAAQTGEPPDRKPDAAPPPPSGRKTAAPRLNDEFWKVGFKTKSKVPGSEDTETWVYSDGELILYDDEGTFLEKASDELVAEVFPKLVGLIDQLPNKRDPWPPPIGNSDLARNNGPKRVLWVSRRMPGPVWVDYVSVFDESGARAETISKILELVEQVRTAALNDRDR